MARQISSSICFLGIFKSASVNPAIAENKTWHMVMAMVVTTELKNILRNGNALKSSLNALREGFFENHAKGMAMLSA